MRKDGVILSRDDAARRGQVLTEIGLRLKEQYDLGQPIPARLAELVGKIEKSGS